MNEVSRERGCEGTKANQSSSINREDNALNTYYVMVAQRDIRKIER